MQRLHLTFALGLLGLMLASGCQPTPACKTDADCGSDSLTCNAGQCVAKPLPAQSVGGVLEGLAPGNNLVLQNNGRDDLTLTADGPFAFSIKVAQNQSYQVTVKRQPADQTCTVVNGSGTVGDAGVTSISVTCSGAPRKVGGTVTGLVAGKSVVLSNNDTELLTVSVDGPFVFQTPVLSGRPYQVTVKTQPVGMVCSVSNGSGTVGTNVNNVLVTCSTNAFNVGGNVSGLVPGGSLVLTNNGEDLRVSNNGTFTFPSIVANGSPYAVTVKTQPTGQVCEVTNGTGTMAGQAVTNILISCAATQHSVGGSVTGLAPGGSLVLTNNGGDLLSVQANGTFTFASTLAYGSTYSVAVKNQPTGQTCTVSGETGTVTSNVANVAVTCTNNAYTLGGTVTGLRTGATLTLASGAQTKAIAGDGPFAFPTALAYGTSYTVTVATQPEGQTCSVTNASGTVGAADVTNVAVTCVTLQYTVGGAVDTLAPGTSLVLTNDGKDDLTLGGSGPFTFATAVAYGGRYSVAVKTQPTGQTCTVSAGTGTVTGNVTNVAVSCTKNLYTLGGGVSGLRTGVTLTLANNGTETLDLTTDGPFTFATKVAYGDAYAVAVKTQPEGQTCTVTNSSGTMGTANVTNVTVACVTSQQTVGGNVTGLASGNTLVLTNNGTDTLSVQANGTFTFTNKLPYGDAYSVAVKTQPTGQTCTVSAGNGTVTGNVANVAVACTTNQYFVRAYVQGLTSGESLVLTNNGTDELSITDSGTFTFTNKVAYQGTYSVSVKTQPQLKLCSVAKGTGTMGAADVTIGVTCSNNAYSVGGTVNSLRDGASVTLSNNGEEDLVVYLPGSFQFLSVLANGSSYEVTVKAQPQEQVCTVVNGTGTLSGANVTNVEVNCVTNRYAVGGTVEGLPAGSSVVLTNNGADDLDVTADGAFSFASKVEFGSSYAVAVKAQPTGYTCAVTSGTGTVAGTVQDVLVRCTADLYAVGGTVAGLSGGATLVLQNNGGDDLSLTAEGPFAFATKVTYGGTYAVTVKTQPAGHSCSVASGSGTVGAADVTDVAVTCGCATGFERNASGVCADIDECATGAKVCSPNATCTNTVGDATCACNVGYSGDGATCDRLPYIQTAVGSVHSCAIAQDKTLWCWGSNTYGQIGDGTSGSTITRWAPLRVGTDTDAWKFVAVAPHHTCAVKDDGTLWCWGRNTTGQLGLGTADTTVVKLPAKVGSASDWVSVSANQGLDSGSVVRANTCAVKTNHTLWCWGDNTRGQIGNGAADATTPTKAPVQVGAGSDWASVSVGGYFFTCANKLDGSVSCWGENTLGEVGNGTYTTPVTSPTPVAVPSTAAPGATWSSTAPVSAGYQHACAPLTDGTLWCWGDNSKGQLAKSSGIPAKSNLPLQVGSATTWAAVGAGLGHTCATQTDKHMYCWGSNGNGQLGNGNTNPTSTPQPVSGGIAWQQFAVGQYHACAIDTQGSLLCWGDNVGVPNINAGQLGNLGLQRSVPTEVTAVGSAPAAVLGSGWYHACSTDPAGKLMCWGRNNSGAIGDGTSGSTIQRESPVLVSNAPTGTWSAMAGGQYHTCGINGGKLYCWGEADNGRLGMGSSTTDVLSPSSTPVTADTNWTTVSLSLAHTCGINGGTLSCWGLGDNGRLGVASGDVATKYTPTPVAGSATWVAVGAGQTHTCGIQTDGTLWCWGSNGQGQLGSNVSTTAQTTPLQESTKGTWSALSVGTYHGCAISKTDSSLSCWGYNLSGQLGYSTGTYNNSKAPTVVAPGTTWTSVAAGDSHTCGIQTNGTLWCWGLGTNGQTGNERLQTVTTPRQVGTASNWVKVVAGFSSTCAINDVGTRYCWGLATYGQLGIGKDGTLLSTTPSLTVQ